MLTFTAVNIIYEQKQIKLFPWYTLQAMQDHTNQNMKGGYWFVSFNRVTFAIANENNKVIDTVSLFRCESLVIEMMMMMMRMNCLCGMVDRRKEFSLISSRDYCQRSSPSRISDPPRAGFEPTFRIC